MPLGAGPGPCTTQRSTPFAADDSFLADRPIPDRADAHSVRGIVGRYTALRQRHLRMELTISRSLSISARRKASLRHDGVRCPTTVDLGSL